MRAYDWLGVSLSALVDVNEGYKVAYGGKNRLGGIEVQDEERRSPPPLKTNFKLEEIERMRRSVIAYSQEDGDVSLSRKIREVEVGESAKGPDSAPSVVTTGFKEDRGPHKRGPTTPNGFEDITPITKGEWCFLMVGEGWMEARKRTAAVETC
jgi:hypothetical protein